MVSIKKSVDLKINEETINNNYEEARSLLEISANLHNEILRLNDITNNVEFDIADICSDELHDNVQATDSDYEVRAFIQGK